MCCAVIENFPRAQVKYRFNDRNNTVYPSGFAEELMRQVALLETLTITEEEIAFMRYRCLGISRHGSTTSCVDSDTVVIG